MKHKVVIAYGNRPTQHDVAGLYHEFPDLDACAYIHVSPYARLSGLVKQTNFDVLVDDIIFKEGLLKPYFELKHFYKNRQASILTTLHEKLKGEYKHFKLIETYDGFGIDFLCSQNDVDENDTLLVKPVNSAESCGQLLIKAGNGYNLNTVVLNLSYVINNVDKLSELIKNNPDNYRYLNDATLETNLEYMVDGSGFIIQKILKGDITEFRLLTDHTGKVTYWQKRMRTTFKEDGWEHVTASGQRNYSETIDLHSELKKQIEIVVSLLDRPLNSFDIMVLDGNFYILEFQPQYGIHGVPRKVLSDIHSNFIRHLVELHIKHVEK